MTSVSNLLFVKNRISIHMPHTWHDDLERDVLTDGVNISIHMPHTWHDKSAPVFLFPPEDFNPHATYVA